MTDKLGERAEQLARIEEAVSLLRDDLVHAESGSDLERNILVAHFIKFQESIAADSANLARGVAIEQAAQAIDKWGRSTIPGDAFVHGSVQVQCYMAGVQTACERVMKAIRSLDPDAAQALAAHDAIERLHTMKMAGHDCDCEPCNMFLEWLNEHDAEIERRARLAMLEEVNQWRTHTSPRTFDDMVRGTLQDMKAALSESQPAPATKPGTYLPCTWLSFARGGMGYCSCGNLGSQLEMVPYPTWETHAADGPAPAKEGEK